MLPEARDKASPCLRLASQVMHSGRVTESCGKYWSVPEERAAALLQEELSGGLAGSEELAQAEEQIAAVQPLFA